MKTPETIEDAGLLEPRFAALDLGTNNCRLLVVRPGQDPKRPYNFRIVSAFSRITRLGEDLAETNMLSKGAMERTLEALQVCAERLHQEGTTHARLVATEALRRASNGSDFVKLVKQETGLELEVISSEEEGSLALEGCSGLLEPERYKNCLLFDIGGGSTEIMWLSYADDGTTQIEAFISLQCGVVTLCDTFGGEDVSEERYEQMIDYVTKLLQPFEQNNTIRSAVRRGEVQMMGTSGTVTTLGALCLGQDIYNREKVDGSWIPFDRISVTAQQLRRMSIEERAENGCIGPQRADLVVPGSAILEAIMRLWPTETLKVADRGIREGILVRLMRQFDV